MQFSLNCSFPSHVVYERRRISDKISHVISGSNEFFKIVVGTSVFFEGGIFFAYKAVRKISSFALVSVFSEALPNVLLHRLTSKSFSPLRDYKSYK